MKLQRNACKASRTPISTIKREKYVILRSLVELTAHKQEDRGYVNAYRKSVFDNWIFRMLKPARTKCVVKACKNEWWSVLWLLYQFSQISTSVVSFSTEINFNTSTVQSTLKLYVMNWNWKNSNNILKDRSETMWMKLKITRAKLIVALRNEQ